MGCFKRISLTLWTVAAVFARPLYADVTVANNPNSTGLSDYTIATENNSGVNYQKTKLIDPTPGSTSGIGIAGNPLYCAVSGVATESSLQSILTELSQKTEPTDVQKVGGSRSGGENKPLQFVVPLSYLNTSSGTLSAGSTATVLQVASHSAKKGDIIQLPSINDWETVFTTTPTSITLEAALSSTPGTIAFNVMRPQFAMSAASTSAVRVPQYANIDINAQNSSTNGILTSDNASFSSGRAGVVILSKRSDSASSTASANGNQAALITDANGKLWSNAEVSGGVAHGATDSGNPIKIGGKARTADPTAVSDGQRVDAMLDKLGRFIVGLGCLTENVFSGMTSSDITNTTSTQVVAAGGAGVKYAVHCISVSNMNATVATRVDLQDGTTAKWPCSAAAGGGGCFTCSPIPFFVGTANTALRAQAATSGANVRVGMAGCKVP